MGKKLMLQWQFGNNAVDCSSHTDAVIDFFAVYTAAMTRNVFQSAGQPHKLPLPLGDLDSHLIHSSLNPPKSTLQMTS